MKVVDRQTEALPALRPTQSQTATGKLLMIVSLLGLVISLFAYLIAFPNDRGRRFDVYAALLAFHLLTSIAFWLYSFEEAMDAFMYYRDPFRFINENPFESGTFFVVHFVQNIRMTLGGSFLDHFLFFQCFGMIGLALMIRSFNEIATSLEMNVPLPVYFTLFLPGFHFWTAGIGKDGPMITAICLAAWSALKIQKRLGWLVLALLIIALIRPHITPFVLAGVIGGLLFTKQISAKARLVLAPIVLAGAVVFVARAAESLNLTFEAESVSDFVEGQQGLGERFGSGAQLQTLSLPARIFTLMFRPFFFDAPGIMGYAASLENATILFFCLYVLVNFRLTIKLARNVFFFTYNIIFAPSLALALSLIIYNMGMGQRMKMMTIPSILLIFGTIYMYKRSPFARPTAVSQQAEPQPAQQVPSQA